MATYYVRLTTLRDTLYKIDADDEEEAIHLVREGEGRVLEVNSFPLDGHCEFESEPSSLDVQEPDSEKDAS